MLGAVAVSFAVVCWTYTSSRDHSVTGSISLLVARTCVEFVIVTCADFFATPHPILCKYQQTGVSIQHLSKQQQSVADALRSAAQTGLLDVVLVRITETKKYVISSASDPQERLLEQAPKIDGWQTLGGTAVPWASTGFNPNHDLMLQAWLISRTA